MVEKLMGNFVLYFKNSLTKLKMSIEIGNPQLIKRYLLELSDCLDLVPSFKYDLLKLVLYVKNEEGWLNCGDREEIVKKTIEDFLESLASSPSPQDIKILCVNSLYPSL